MKNLTFSITQKEQTTIIVGESLLQTVGEIVEKEQYTGFLLVCSPQTQELYEQILLSSLKKLDLPIKTFVIENGEEHKSLATVEKALRAMLEAGLDKRSAVLALGGGIAGDVATLIAGLYYRGIDCIQIPTTLLAQVDSAYGGKGGVNLDIYKNMIGVIKQPRFVIVDTDTLKTLPKIQILSGLGEAVKYGIAHDSTFFDYLASHTPETVDLEELIQRCSSIKMGMVEKDPLDTGTTRIALNFGHTLGHAVERLGDLPHGLAVAVGMAFAIQLSEKAGILQSADAAKALSLLKQYGLPTTIEKVDKDAVLEIMKKDKKAVGGKIRFVLLSTIGKTVVVDSIDPKLIDTTLAEVII